MDELGASRRRQGLEAVVGAASISSKVTRGPWCLGQTCRLGLGHAPFEHNDETLYATGPTRPETCVSTMDRTRQPLAPHWFNVF